MAVSAGKTLRSPASSNQRSRPLSLYHQYLQGSPPQMPPPPSHTGSPPQAPLSLVPAPPPKQPRPQPPPAPDPGLSCSSAPSSRRRPLRATMSGRCACGCCCSGRPQHQTIMHRNLDSAPRPLRSPRCESGHTDPPACRCCAHRSMCESVISPTPASEHVAFSSHVTVHRLTPRHRLREPPRGSRRPSRSSWLRSGGPPAARTRGAVRGLSPTIFIHTLSHCTSFTLSLSPNHSFPMSLSLTPLVSPPHFAPPAARLGLQGEWGRIPDLLSWCTARFVQLLNSVPGIVEAYMSTDENDRTVRRFALVDPTGKVEAAPVVTPVAPVAPVTPAAAAALRQAGGGAGASRPPVSRPPVARPPPRSAAAAGGEAEGGAGGDGDGTADLSEVIRAEVAMASKRTKVRGLRR